MEAKEITEEIKSKSDDTGLFAKMGNALNLLHDLGHTEHAKSIGEAMGFIAKRESELERLRKQDREHTVFKNLAKWIVENKRYSWLDIADISKEDRVSLLNSFGYSAVDY